PRVAHVAGHLLAREHATRGLTLTDRARGTVRQRVTVGGITHGEAVPLDGAGKTLALGHAGDIDHLTDAEQVSLDLRADAVVADLALGDPELPQPTTCLDLGLGKVAGKRLVDQRSALGAGGDLDGGVAVVLDGLD